MGSANIPDCASIIFPAVGFPLWPFRRLPLALTPPLALPFGFSSSFVLAFAACFSAFRSAFFSALAFSRSFSALASARFLLRFFSQASHLQPIGFRYALQSLVP